MLLRAFRCTVDAFPSPNIIRTQSLALCLDSSPIVDAVHEKRLLLGVLRQEVEQQERKRVALEQQLTSGAQYPRGNMDEDSNKLAAKHMRRMQQVPARLADVDAVQERCRLLMEQVRTRGTDLASIRDICSSELNLGTRLETFDVNAMGRRQFGRPDGFDGLVVESPRGIPILVARQSFSDSLLRQIGRGSDLWFQVAEMRGSRVLLRTSMLRGLARSPRQCMEMAADLAAYFSDWRQSTDEVEIMFTDSRHVAKRGTRVGQMKRKKALGMLPGRPWRAASVAAAAQEEQGWL